MKKNNFLWSTCSIKVKGLNIERFLNILLKENIYIKDLQRVEYDEIVFYTLFANYQKILSKTENMCYNISVEKVYGFRNLLDLLKRRTGLFIGSLIALFLVILLNSFTLNFTILGLEKIERENVIEKIEEFGIKIGGINSFKNKELELYLQTSIEEISLVSVKKKGTTLIVNIKEKLPDIDTEIVEPIVAGSNLLITELEVFSGICFFKVGDIVRKGEILVHPEKTVSPDGKEVKIKPIAKVVGDVWYSASTEYFKEENVVVRTGNKVVNSVFLLGKTAVWENKKTNPFKSFEYERVERQVSYNFIPIFIQKDIYYEVVYENKVNNFEKDKDLVIRDTLEKALKLVPKNTSILEENFDIVETQDSFIVAVYLKSTLEINGE